jgi:DNA-3-methyladenine glycosylase
VARSLLGKHFVRIYRGKKLMGKIVETEAYRGNDSASHSFHGQTERNKSMFSRGGFLYVYFTYGMHFCANVVTGKVGIGEAVLIRAVEPILGECQMKRLRNRKNIDVGLTNGPAKFCQAFGITCDNDGIDLLGGQIYLVEGDPLPVRMIESTTRIGIRNAREKRWRFFVRGSAWVSKK